MDKKIKNICTGRRLPVRIQLGILAFLGFVNLYIVRSHLSVSLVAMVRHDAAAQATLVSDACGGGGGPTGPVPQDALGNWTSSVLASNNASASTQGEEEEEESTSHQQTGELDWDERTQGFVLSTFYYGYVITQIAGGRAAELYGGTRVFGLSIFVSGILCFFIPFCARMHYLALAVVRFLQGLAQAPVFPAMHAVSSQWVPAEERTQFLGPVYYATSVGVMLAMPLSGLLIDTLGWASASYFAGLAAVVWSAAWFLLTSTKPANHPRISLEEREKIEKSIELAGTSGGVAAQAPWRDILRSPPVWALNAVDFGNGWGLSLFVTQVPTYMRNILGLSIKQNGLMSALPFVARYIGVHLFSQLFGRILRRGLLTTTRVRKVSSVIMMLFPAAFLVAVSYSGCSAEVTIALMCTAFFFNGAVAAAYTSNHIDVSPNYAGTLMGLANTAHNVAAMTAPMLTGFIINRQQTLERWRWVFWTCVPVYVVTEVIFLVFASGEVQPWNFRGQSQELPQQEPDDGDDDDNDDDEEREVGHRSESGALLGPEEAAKTGESLEDRGRNEEDQLPRV
ncbi:putative inorganic phosphate cotransporter [Oratosquilla oratoria]|uniref:putative inorganic phosphate cotransporter n=1 Tax=Oratosquilla oratoria TaxID=337810 RepID=UPI003F75E8F2